MSTAPLVSKNVLSLILLTVLISLRSESKGISPTRECFLRTSSSSRPYSSPKLTRAISVGSPISFCSAVTASLQSRAVRTSFFSRSLSGSKAVEAETVLSTYTFSTVILFWVSVPVLSEQMTVMLPRPSTAYSFLTMAFFWAIFCVPRANTIVTMELSASGIAATARETANKKAVINSTPR